MQGGLEDIVGRLRLISEELADIALDELKTAHAAGQTRRPEREKHLTQARRAVEKAVAVLSRVDSGD
jgi:hypothetical protein